MLPLYKPYFTGAAPLVAADVDGFPLICQYSSALGGSLGLNIVPVGYETTVSTNQAIGFGNCFTPYVATANITATIAHTTTLTSFWYVDLFAQSGTITIVINGSDKLNNGSAGVGLVMPPGSSGRLITDGAGNLFLTGTAPGLSVNTVANAVNYLSTTSEGTGSAPLLGVGGSDTNVSLGFYTKGTGGYAFYTNANVLQFALTHTANAVNFVSFSGGATGATPIMSAVGSDSVVSMQYTVKNNGNHTFSTNGTSNVALYLPGNGNTVNYVSIYGGATGNAANVTAAGSDTNIDLAIASKGTGVVKFATASNFTANGAVATAMTSVGPTGSHTTVQEWLTIKNASGTVRYIPCY